LKKSSWLAAACCLTLPAAGWQRFEAVQPHMGTLVRITLYARGAAEADAAFSKAFSRIAELEEKLSDYKPSSELNRLRCGSPLIVSEDLYSVLETARRINAATSGAFDVTLGPAVRLWRQTLLTQQLPDPSRRAAAGALTGFHLLRLNSAESTVEMLRCGMQLDLGGIGKGYAATQALLALQRSGHPRALVAIAGDLAIGEPPPGSKTWRIEAQGQVHHLARCSISTSGDKEQFTIIDGIRYSHVLDPKTGIGAVGARPATVIANDGAVADALATALHIGGEPMLPVIESMHARAILAPRR